MFEVGKSKRAEVWQTGAALSTLLTIFDTFAFSEQICGQNATTSREKQKLVSEGDFVITRLCYSLRNAVRLLQRVILDLEGYRRFSRWRAATYSSVSGNS
jgi:hypothetical protein